jgi:hypothetical protein
MEPFESPNIYPNSPLPLDNEEDVAPDEAESKKSPRGTLQALVDHDCDKVKECCPAEAPQCYAYDKDQCQAKKFKDCRCETLDFGMQEVGFAEPFPPVASSETLQKQATEALEKIWGGDRSKMPGLQN